MRSRIRRLPKGSLQNWLNCPPNIVTSCPQTPWRDNRSEPWMFCLRVSLMRVKSFFGVIFNFRCLSCVCHQDLGAIAVVSASDFLALKLCGIQVETKFMSEVDDSKISMSKAMHARYGCSPQVHGDITLRNPKDMDQVDLFVSGAPCPAYSTAGLKKGIKDLRGCVILHSLKYIVPTPPRRCLPRKRERYDSQKPQAGA